MVENEIENVQNENEFEESKENQNLLIDSENSQSSHYSSLSSFGDESSSDKSEHEKNYFLSLENNSTDLSAKDKTKPKLLGVIIGKIANLDKKLEYSQEYKQISEKCCRVIKRME